MDDDFTGQPLSWRSSSSEEMDSQGVIGEYSDAQEESESSSPLSNDRGLGSKKAMVNASTESVQMIASSSASIPHKPTQEKTSNHHLAESDTLRSISYPGENRPTLPTLQKEQTGSQTHLLQSTAHPSQTADQNSALLSAGPGLGPELTDTDSPGRTAGISVTTQGNIDGPTNITDLTVGRGTASSYIDEDTSKKEDLQILKTRGTVSLDGDMDTSLTPCKTSNQPWTPTYPEDFTPSGPLHPLLALSPALLVPLYSDWNSALATWRFAWEVHIYGLGCVFAVFCLISTVSLLGLPLRCPPGTPYFTMLHLFILAFSGIQGFSLLYDAYSFQDRLPPLASLLLSELSFPCLISAFSLSFLLLSLHSRMHLSRPFVISTSFSASPKPCLLLTLSVLHFIISLGCFGIFQFFHNLPIVILLFPQGMFVCLTILLSCLYFIFYCLAQVNTKNIYRLNDNGESGGSPEIFKPAVSPFANWYRAAGVGLGTSLCFLGCGGFQLYGILHILGLGGVDGYGLQPWPWWGFQIGRRLCEIGVCLGLSVIGIYPLFYHKSSKKALTHPPRGSWSRLSCSSPSRMTTIPSRGGANSPVLSSQISTSQGKQEKLVVCDVVTKEQSETLPLGSIVDPTRNRSDSVQSPIQAQTIPHPTQQNLPHEQKNAAEFQLSSSDSLGLETDSTVDLRPPSPIELSRSIDQALFNESLFSHSIFGFPRLLNASSLSLSSPSQSTSKQGPNSVENTLFRTSSCGDVDQENSLPISKPLQPRNHLGSHSNPPVSPEQCDWKWSITGSTHGLWSTPNQTGKLRSHSWANRGQSLAQSSFPRAIPHLSYHRRYRTLSTASRDSQRSGRLVGTKHLSESKQLEWDLAVQAEFVSVCRQIDALSVCSDTIEL
ncbi:proline-rich transmembrane protein 4 isoform 2-T3 [Pholidichthys leucotaenia]